MGRPNVGKSALFNRLVRRRLAIVHEQEGVTRDRLIARTNWLGCEFEVVDTGGLALMDKAKTSDAITAATTEQALAAMEDADVLILVTDIQAGLQPMDENVVKLLRKTQRPIFVAANKADEEALDEKADEFSRLGLSVFPVSASHNRGVEELLKAVVRAFPKSAEENSAPEADAEERADAESDGEAAGTSKEKAKEKEKTLPLKVAVIGRPNVGKSSYINRLIGKERVIVSDVAGTTRDSIEVPFTLGNKQYILIDTAGMRRQGKVHDSVEKFSLFRAEKTSSPKGCLCSFLRKERRSENAHILVCTLKIEQQRDKKRNAKAFGNRRRLRLN